MSVPNGPTRAIAGRAARSMEAVLLKRDLARTDAPSTPNGLETGLPYNANSA